MNYGQTPKITNFDSQQYFDHPQQHLRACVHDFAKCKFTLQEL